MSARRFLLSCLTIVFAMGSAQAQRGAMTAPRTLQEMVSQAQTIVRGRVLLARVEPHPQYRNLSTVVVVLGVEETLKGAPGESLRLRQFIWDPRDRDDAAGYQRGQRVLLLLNRQTAAGLTTPVGLQQGRFRIVTDASGNEMAINGHGNTGLFSDREATLSAAGARLTPRARALVAEHRSGPVSLQALEETIHAMSGSAGRPE